jgi:hypothetical protein
MEKRWLIVVKECVNEQTKEVDLRSGISQISKANR